MDVAVDRHEKRNSLKVTGYETHGHRATCTCDAAPGKAIVLDPFAGSGSTLIAARKLGRSGVGLDLNLNYILTQACERLGINAVKAWTNGKKAVANTDNLPMFSGEFDS